MLSVSTLSLSGCAAKQAAPPNAPQAESAEGAAELGPVRATVEISPPKARLSDELTLTLTIESAEGVAVQKPPFGEKFCDFLIRDIREPPLEVRDGRNIVRQILTLEPTRAGRITIDPIAVQFSDAGPDGDGKTHTLETRPISVEIVSQVGDEAPALDEMRGAAGPVGLTAPAPLWVWLAAGTFLAALLVAWRLRRRRGRESVAAVAILSPEEIAGRELDELVASGLAGRDIKQFYVELTGIVRRYIERTTGIRAPEQTTEEFLREISRDDSLSRWERVREREAAGVEQPSPPAPLPKGEGNRLQPSPPAPLPKVEGRLSDIVSRLRDFLEAADLVKFAAHRPRPGDIDESVRRARLFIGLKGSQSVSAAAPEEAAV